jgi:hypothetical protein
MPSLLLDCKDHLNVFNKIQALFSAFVSAGPLLSTLSKLFSPKQGVRGIGMLPKSLRVCCSRYLQCSQQNTNSCALFAAPIFCFQHFVDSFGKNTGEWVRVCPAKNPNPP